jgi:DNA (cytosine-5)-methyltransferase 1
MTRIINIADLFCGAGGSSTGAAQAIRELGMTPRITAVNHWPIAVKTHAANHIDARHLCASLDSLNPRDLFSPGELDMLIASPECTHHSVARGGMPINDQSRATAWCVVRWVDAMRPADVLIENVPEFQTWGPIGSNGRPLKSRKGETFKAWVAAIESLGYRVEWRVLIAADYGDATSRRRLFVRAVRGNRRIVWPAPTHSKDTNLFGLPKWKPAADIIDWQLKGEPISQRKKPLSAKTMARIRAGLERFGGKPFVVAWDHQSAKTGEWSADEPLGTVTTKARHGVCEPFIVTMRGTERGQVEASARSTGEPLPTVAANGTHHALCEPFLVKTNHATGNRLQSTGTPLPTICGNRGEIALCEPFIIGQHGGSSPKSVNSPLGTVTTTSRGIKLCEPFLVQYYGNGGAASVNDPLDTVTCKDRFALVEPTAGPMIDVRFRMLQPHELAAAQGFPSDYQFTGNKSEVVKQIGNAVPCGLARALVRAALGGVVSVTKQVAA